MVISQTSDLQSYASLDLYDLYKRRRWSPRRRMHCLISFSHHAYMYQAIQDKVNKSDTLTLVFILVRCDCISTSILYDHTQRCLNSPAFF